MSGIYPGINSIGAFREHSYASICSLNFAEKGPVYIGGQARVNQCKPV